MASSALPSNHKNGVIFCISFCSYFRPLLAINVLTMPHPLDLHDPGPCEHLINDSVITDTNTMSMLRPDQFFGAVRERVLGQSLNFSQHALNLARRQFPKVLPGRGPPLNAKGGHLASTPP